MKKTLPIILGCAAVLACVPANVKAEESSDKYVMMNIPYAEFYEAELGAADAVDTVTSATTGKYKNSDLVAGSYYQETEGVTGGTILGVTYPVKVDSSVTLSDDSKVEETALTSSASYSYYELDEAPGYYKELKLDTDGSYTFGEAATNDTDEKTYKTEDTVYSTLSTSTRYGDYQLNLYTDEATTKSLSYDTVYAVVVKTADNKSYGLRHLENIWRKSQLAWSVGVKTTEAHGNTLSYEDYTALEGATVTSVVYYTNEGIATLTLGSEVYLPYKAANASVTVATPEADAKTTSVTVTGLPDEYTAAYALDGTSVNVGEDGTFSIEGLTVGSHTLTVSDSNNKYEDLTATFTVSTTTQPATFDSTTQTIVAADGQTAEALAAYLNNIASVSVNGTSYSASGKRKVEIVKKDGTLNSDNYTLLAGENTFVVTATGYPELTFTINGKYVMMNIPYAEFYEAELGAADAVDTVTSATTGKYKNSNLVAGSYYEETEGVTGGTILGVTYPVLVDNSVTLSDGSKVEAANITSAASYSYYELTETPEFYKKLTLDSESSFAFGAAKTTDDDAYKTESTVYSTLSTSTRYGDYQLNLYTDEAATELLPYDTVYAVVLKTKDGNSYGLRHLENIWRKSQLAWSVGVKTTEAHGNTLSYEDYKALEGATVTSVVYYTNEGIATLTLNSSVYLPKKVSGASVTVTAETDATTASVTVTGLPDEYTAAYALDGTSVTVGEDGTFSIEGLTVGSHTLTVSDSNGTYEDLTASFAVSTATLPAAFDSDTQTIVAAEGQTAEALTAYLKNITSVSVNGTSYSASGKRKVEIVKEDGTLNSDNYTLLTGTNTFVVTSTGYPELTFTIENDIDYVLMNIPYAEFYAADVNNTVAVDAFTSATKTKTRTGTLAGGSYHVDSTGDAINGVTFPVKVPEGTDLSAYTQVTDDNTVTITVTNRGKESTTTYTGKEALFESADYSYYVLSETPSYYKEMTGTETFGAVQGTATEVTAYADLLTESSYGDYQLNLYTDSAKTTALSYDTVYAVIVETKEGSSYGMRHIENIWRTYELAWCTGYTTAVHGCTTSSAHYAAMMGQTITGVTYYTSDGIKKISNLSIYVPIKFGGSVTVAEAATTAEETGVTFGVALPSGFNAAYAIDGTATTAANNMVSLKGLNLKPGTHELTVSDASGKYASLSAEFTVVTSENTVTYDGTALTSDDATETANYIANITKVTVNGTEYSASGRGATVIIKEDGTVDETTANLTDKAVNVLVVTATGYPDYTFTIDKRDEQTLTLTETSYTKTYGDEAFKLEATATGALTYASSDEKVVTVDAEGNVTVVGAGKAEITVTAAESETMKPAEAKVTVKVKKAAQTITVTKSYAKVLGAKAFKLKAKTDGDGKLTYKSSNTKVAKVSSAGKVTIKGVGTAKITVTAAKTTNVKKATATVTIKVSPKAVKLSSVKSASAKTLKVTWKKNASVTGYQVQYSTSKTFKSAKKVTVKKAATTTTTLKKLTSGKKYYVRVRTYQKVSGKTYYSKWSAAKNVKVK